MSSFSHRGFTFQVVLTWNATFVAYRNRAPKFAFEELTSDGATETARQAIDFWLSRGLEK